MTSTDNQTPTVSQSPAFDQLWDYDHPDQTEARFRQALPRYAVGSAPYVELLTQIARAQGLQRHFDAAHATLDEAATWLAEQPVAVQVRYQLERGRVFNSAGDRQAAEPCFQAALTLGQRSGEDYYAIDAAHMLAIVAPPSEQHRWNLQALAMVEASTDPRTNKWRGSLHNNIGWTYYESGDYAKALDHFTKALAVREAQGQAGAIQIARWCVAKALRALDRVPEALTIQSALQVETEAAGTPDGYVYEELGECHLALGEQAQAQPYFAKAYQLLVQDEWLVAQEGARLARLQRLGNGAE